MELNYKALKEEPFNIQDEEARKLLVDSIGILKSYRIKSVEFWELEVFDL